MKRLIDLILSSIGLLVSSPLLVTVIVAVWAYDRHSPFYVAKRVGQHGRPFRMVKLRSMRVDADKIGVDSTSARDPRITPGWRFLCRHQLDQLTPALNALID